MSDANYISDPHPFWFLGSELLTNVIVAEIGVARGLLAEHSELPHWFDNPEARPEQRKICFVVASRAKVLFSISDTIAARYEEASQLSKDELETYQRISHLIAADAPAWVLEMALVIDRMPSHLHAALPESLRTRRFDESREQSEAVNALSTQEQIQAFIQRVVDQQLERLSKRWSVELPLAREYPSSHPNDLPLNKPVKRKAIRTRDKVRMKRDRTIFEIDDSSETMTEFIRLMDERGVAPLPTWPGWPGTWSRAYRNDRLRRLITQDKYRALERSRRKK